MRPVELRRLRWRDLDPFARLIIVRRSKTDAGTQQKVSNASWFSGMTRLKRRADTLGADEMEHYILPHMAPTLDPTRAMGSLRLVLRLAFAAGRRLQRAMGKRE